MPWPHLTSLTTKTLIILPCPPHYFSPLELSDILWLLGLWVVQGPQTWPEQHWSTTTFATPAVLCHEEPLLGALDVRAGSLWHKTAGASITREVLDQWERSNLGAGPMREDQSDLNPPTHWPEYTVYCEVVSLPVPWANIALLVEPW